MVTLVACPKSFVDRHIATIQTNAITSWTLLRPRPDIILIGGDPGIAEICSEYDLKHVPSVERNEHGTPLLSSVLTIARQLTEQPFLCYVNADIILTSSFSRAVQGAHAFPKPFLMSGGRWNIDVTDSVDFRREDWESRIVSKVQQSGVFAFFSNDYFVFPSHLFCAVPPLAIGRAWFDAWFFREARSRGGAVIDAGSAVMAVHQNHHYKHTATKDATGVWVGAEADRNAQLVGSRRRWFLMEATHVLTGDVVRRTRGRKMRYRLRELLIHKTGSIRRPLNLNRAGLRRLKRLLGHATGGSGGP